MFKYFIVISNNSPRVCHHLKLCGATCSKMMYTWILCFTRPVWHIGLHVGVHMDTPWQICLRMTEETCQRLRASLLPLNTFDGARHRHTPIATSTKYPSKPHNPNRPQLQKQQNHAQFRITICKHFALI
jgi:hypothetical protein